MMRGYCGLFITLSVISLLSSGCATSRSARSERRGLFSMLKEPGAGKKRAPASTPPAARAVEEETGGAPSDTSKNLHLRWPVEKVEVTSQYGKRGDGFHEGVDIRARTGTPVLAAQSGTVLYAGRKVKGYGNLVILKHHNGVATIYAHNSRILVRQGQKVKRGQRIALSGATGNVSGPHVHFEVREGVAAVDPSLVLPNPQGTRLSKSEMGPIRKPSSKR